VAKRATRKIVVQDVTKKWNPRATDQKTWKTPHSQTLNDFSKIINMPCQSLESTTQQACVRNLGLWHSNKETKGTMRCGRSSTLHIGITGQGPSKEIEQHD
jgi:hypothetical protein